MGKEAVTILFQLSSGSSVVSFPFSLCSLLLSCHFSFKVSEHMWSALGVSNLVFQNWSSAEQVLL